MPQEAILMLVPREHVEWAVQRGDDEPIPVECPSDLAERAARRMAQEFNRAAAGAGWHTVCRVREMPWVRR